MFRTIKTAVVSGSFALSLAGAAGAAHIGAFYKTTNDGVYDLSSAEALALGYAGAKYIGYFRVREGNGVTFGMGDSFDTHTILNSTQDDSKIIALLNGTNAGLGYAGGILQALGKTTIASDASSFYEGVAFLFSTTSNIVFSGTSTFNASQSRGALPYDVAPASVPLPAALPMLAAAIGAIGLASRRRKPG